MATSWDGVVKLRPATLRALAGLYGGELRGGAADAEAVSRLVPVERAGPGDLAPLLTPRYARHAARAAERGAVLLVDSSVADAASLASLASTPACWVHTHAAWAMAAVLDAHADVPDLAADVAESAQIGPHVVLGPRVVIGARVTIAASSVIGRPGFGWATGPRGDVRAVPQLGGVIIEDDVVIGPLCTVDAGTLAPTRIRRGAKLDAQVHVGHNCTIGEGTIVAAQSGFAGSVTVGRGVLVGGQVGVADHVTIGDGARLAAKSGVIGDVPAGATVAGYPALPRAKWLRALAWLNRASALDQRD